MAKRTSSRPTTTAQGVIPPDPAQNLLPCDGTVNYFGPIYGPDEAHNLLEALLHGIPWQHDEAVMFGKRIVTARKVAWYGDAEFSYTYSGITKRATPWTPALKNLKATAEKWTGATYNSCLLNLYHHGGEGMAWHSDDEKMLAPNAPIASLSFGAERKFCFKHKQTGQTISLILEAGSLLVMKGTTQKHWLHRLPPTTRVTTPRINLTFRTITT